MSTEEIEEALAGNIAEFMEKGPGLRTSTAVWVCAVDEVNGLTYLSGLGGMGVGSMWSTTQDYHRGYTGWDDAPRVETAFVAASLFGYRAIVKGDADAAEARTAVGQIFGPRGPRSTQ